MPPFRIHQTRFKPERILIRLIQGRYVIPQYVPPGVVEEKKEEPEPKPKKKNTITLNQIKQVLQLLQKSEHKNLNKLLSPELVSLLSLDEDKVDDIEELGEVEDSESEVELEAEADSDDDILIIDV